MSRTSGKRMCPGDWVEKHDGGGVQLWEVPDGPGHEQTQMPFRESSDTMTIGKSPSVRLLLQPHVEMQLC